MQYTCSTFSWNVNYPVSPNTFEFLFIDVVIVENIKHGVSIVSE